MDLANLRRRLTYGLKLALIILLTLLIGLVTFLHWKGDAILREVIGRVDRQLVDTISYTDAALSFFRHFPSASVRLEDLTIGQPAHPLLEKGDIDLVLPLLPLLRGRLVLERVIVSDGKLEIARRDSRWTYDLFKPGNESGDTSRITDIRSLAIRQCELLYDDGDGTSLSLRVEDAWIQGQVEATRTKLSFTVEGICHQVKAGGQVLAPGSAFHLDGDYALDPSTGTHTFKRINLVQDGMDVELNGSVSVDGRSSVADLEARLATSNLDSLARWLPESLRATIRRIGLAGSLEGTYSIRGPIDGPRNPHQAFVLKLSDGQLTGTAASEKIDNLEADVVINLDAPARSDEPRLRATITQKALLGKRMRIDAVIADEKEGLLNLRVDGPVPARLFNLLQRKDLVLEDGRLAFNDLVVDGYPTRQKLGLHETLALLHGEVGLDGLKATFAGNRIEVPAGRITKEDAHQVSLDLKSLTYDQAVLHDVDATLTTTAGKEMLGLKASFCGGHVQLDGDLTYPGGKPRFEADWHAQGVEIRDIFTAFNEFDQDFLTSRNLSGKANAWAHTIVPMDADWKVRYDAMEVISAIDISDGRLQGLKTLEDFSDYIHLADLRDIRFSRLRNYLRIERGEVLLPVMFIQSSAINLSISGRHGFDQKVDYDLKVNAGQTVAQRIKKREGGQALMPSRKSGWINLYFRLFGTVSDVRYLQDRKGVLAGFEASSLLKERLRTELVDRFGYDVYWLEPNEWEDIPEYR